jgi:hypothetical protein
MSGKPDATDGKEREQPVRKEQVSTAKICRQWRIVVSKSSGRPVE